MAQVRDIHGEKHSIELKVMSQMCSLSAVLEEDWTRPSELNSSKELAVYSDDRPIEFWRSIPDFIEASSIGDEVHG